MFMVCKVFRALLLDKDVTLIPKDKKVEPRPSELECIKPCRVLRCRSISFASSMNLSWLVDEITSIQPCQDLLPTWIKIGRVITDLPEVNGVCFTIVKQREGDTIMDDLRDAVMQADVARAERHVSVLTDRLATWNVIAYEQKVVEVRQEHEGRLAQLREVGAEIPKKMEEVPTKPPFRQ